MPNYLENEHKRVRICNCRPQPGYLRLLFRNADARAAIAGHVAGLALYGVHNFILYQPGVVWPGDTVYQHFGLNWLNYFDIMLGVLAVSVLVAPGANRWGLGHRAVLDISLLGR